MTQPNNIYLKRVTNVQYIRFEKSDEIQREPIQ
jgi:hypothetical protein